MYNAKEKVDKKIPFLNFFSREVQGKDFFKLNKFLTNNLIRNFYLPKSKRLLVLSKLPTIHISRLQ